MASPTTPSSGTCSGSDHQENIVLMNQRKRKRMLSNRESARRSRMRKQRHLDDLMAQMTHLTAENHQILTDVHAVNQLFMNVESENSVLSAQMSELRQRLQVLNDIINSMINSNKIITTVEDFSIKNKYGDSDGDGDDAGDLLNPWTLIDDDDDDVNNNYQPINMCSWIMQDVGVNY